MRYFFNKLKLKTKLVMLICFVFILAVIVENIYIIHVVNNEHLENSRQHVENVATLVSSSNEIIRYIENPTPENLEKNPIIC